MDSPVDLAIEAVGLTKVFGKTRAVDGVDLAVRKGTVYGFLGPNGAGKTTTIRMLATLLRPDGGTARVFGHDLVREADAVRRRVSLTGQFASVDEDLSGWENLLLLGRLQGYSRTQARARARELLEAFDLADASNRQAKKYSGGMRRRLDIAASLLVIPDLLFLDEPTTGLDPQSRVQVWGLVRAIVGKGTTVLLTTQYLEEADQLSDRIAVINQGKIMAEGTSAQLKASMSAGTVRVRLFDTAQRPEAERVLAQAFAAPVHLESDPTVLTVQVSASPDAQAAGERVAHALTALSRAGVTVSDFALGQPSLDEVFLALTSHPAENHVAITEEAL